MSIAQPKQSIEEKVTRKAAIWSATPTPLTVSEQVDISAVRRMIDYHVRLGTEGVMLAGTCGEGPWLSRAESEKLVRTGIEQAGDAVQIALQVTDNSPAQILERLEILAGWGGKLGVIAQPYFFMNGTVKRLRDFYLEVWDRSPLPLALYDRGKNAAVPIPLEILEEVTSHPKVQIIKDSSGDPARFEALRAAQRANSELRIFSGIEFDLVNILQSGYDGVFFGGAIVTGQAVRRCVEFFRAGEIDAAKKVDEKTKQALFDIYGGPKISSWLAGLKYYLTRLGIFDGWANIPGYPLTGECRAAIDKLLDDGEWMSLASPV